jgi:hypothetical protein
MKPIAILLFSCVMVFGADDDVRVLTDIQHLSWGATNIVDYYMRGGETNLICTMLIAPREPLRRFHQLFHGGERLGCYVTGTNSSGCITYPSSRYMLSFSLGPSNELRGIVIGNEKGEVVDAFGCTNGVITPVSTSMLRQAEPIDMRRFVHPESIRRHVWGEPYSRDQ